MSIDYKSGFAVDSADGITPFSVIIETGEKEAAIWREIRRDML